MSLDERAHSLIARHLNGVATEDEIRLLDREIASNAEVADALARAALMDTHLTSVFAEGITLSPQTSIPRWRGVATVLLVAATLAVVVGLRSVRHRSTASLDVGQPPAATSMSRAAEVHLADGSTITPLGEDTVVEPGTSDRSEVSVKLVRGSANFDIRHDTERVFRVVAGWVTVEVLGTSFTVAIDTDRVHVNVARGQVRVLSQATTSYLAEGQEGTFLSQEASAMASAPSNAPADPLREPERSWRNLARSGDYDRAFESLQREGPSAVRDEPGELILAADAARLSKHPAQALAPLRKVVAHHRSDPRAPLAAFTLGRVLLDELAKPSEAAVAFAEARALIGSGSLAEDALAREIEARSRAGDAAKARELALLYVERYPGGSKLQSVRRYGRLP